MEKNYMNRQVAEVLVSELERQFPQIPLGLKDKEEMIRGFEVTPILESSKFDEELKTPPGSSGRVHFDLREEDRIITLYPTRIIRNANAKNLKMNLGKYLNERLHNQFGWYSSTFISRHVRKDKPVVQLMLKCAKESKNPEKDYMALSALFRLKQSDLEETARGNSSLVEIDRPILIIPGITPDKREPIQEFEIDEGKVLITVNYGMSSIERVYSLKYKEYIEGLKSGNLPHLK